MKNKTNILMRIFLLGLCVCCFSGLLAQNANTQKNLIIIPDSSEFVTLYDANEFDLKHSELFLNWNGYPYIMRGNTIIELLYDSVFNIFELPDKSSPTQLLCTTEGITYLKNGKLIQIMKDDDIQTLLTLPDTQFHIGLADNSLLYITRYIKDSSTIFLYDTDLFVITKLFTVEGKINDVAGDGLHTYLAKGGEIFLLSDSEIFKIMEIEQDITTLALSDYGLFFSTSQSIGYIDIDKPYQPFPFINKPAKKLLTWDNQMYIQFNDGTISILFGLEYFEYFVESIYNNN